MKLITALAFTLFATTVEAHWWNKPKTIATPQPATELSDTTGKVRPAAVNTESSGSLGLTGNLSADIANAVQFIRVDTQNALVAAQTAKPVDDVGVQCFQANLAFLDLLSTPAITTSGLISNAERLRLQQRGVINNLPAWYSVRDKCSGVFNVGQVFRPLAAVIPALAPIP